MSASTVLMHLSRCSMSFTVKLPILPMRKHGASVTLPGEITWSAQVDKCHLIGLETSIITYIRKFFVKGFKWKVFMLGIEEASDDMSSKFFRNKLFKSHLSHASFENSSIFLISLLPSIKTSFFIKLLQCLSECQYGVCWRSKPECKVRSYHNVNNTA